MEARKPQTLFDDISDLDRKLVKLIARRSELVQKLVGTRKKSPAALARIAITEKDLRKNWESAAAQHSRDERFLRQLFSLLQELELTPLAPVDEDGVRKNPAAFNLAPPRCKVDVKLPLLASALQSRLWFFLAASAAQPVRLAGQILGDAEVELIKALNQAGAHLSWNEVNEVVSACPAKQGFGPLVFADKVIYAGEDAFNFYLLSALALGQPGVVKFTGGSNLKLHDFSAWRNVLPLLGARLAHVVPKSTGLPVHQECSALIPEQVELTADLCADLPSEALLALALAAPFWPCGAVLELPADYVQTWAEILKAALPIFEACSIGHNIKGRRLEIKAGCKQIPSNPVLPIDPLLGATLLALPAFAKGGQVELAGGWAENEPGAKELFGLLGWAGLSLKRSDKQVFSSFDAPAPSDENKKTQPPVLQLARLLPEARPLAVVLAARYALVEKMEITLSLDESADLFTVKDFLAFLGLELISCGKDKLNDKFKLALSAAGELSPAWTAPSAFWGMALALGAYLRGRGQAGTGLNNAVIVSSAAPAFWHIYNSLPQGRLQAKTTEVKNEPARRRVIARNAHSDI